MDPPLLYRLALLLSLSLLANAIHLPGPYKIYKTQPRFLPSLINVTYYTNDKSLIEPGYTFIAPHIGMTGYGPEIIDQDGNLVWYGNPGVTHIKGSSVYAMNFYACDFMGQRMNHLCYSEARPKEAVDVGIKEGGANRIFNDAYQPVVADFVDMGNLSVPNPHEFNVLPGGNTFVQAVYQKRPMDLRPYKGTEDGWVWDGCIQEIDLHSRSSLFQWCYLDHYPVHDTFLYLHIEENMNDTNANASSSTSGRGIFKNPWDFMHLNAVDKNEEGDYLISGRHLSSILKIAGPNSASGKSPGTTLWRLNGKYSDFEMDEDALFARQHHSRFISTGRNETVISLFNNAFNSTYTIGDRSTAMILRLNNYTMKASLDTVFRQPEPRLSFAQGSVSIIPGSRQNVFVGWGSHPEWSEFSRDGTLLYHAETWANLTELGKKLTNYRSFKFKWVGRPHYPPKLLAYSKTCKNPPMVYVSWNGATEVGSWRFYVSDAQHSPRTDVGTFVKEGFETSVRLSLKNFTKPFARWVTVEALDKQNGTVLSTASAKTFVPKFSISDLCDEESCFSPPRFEHNPRFSRECEPQIPVAEEKKPAAKQKKPVAKGKKPIPIAKGKPPAKINESKDNSDNNNKSSSEGAGNTNGSNGNDDHNGDSNSYQSNNINSNHNALIDFDDSMATRVAMLLLVVLTVETWVSFISKAILGFVHRQASRRPLRDGRVRLPST